MIIETLHGIARERYYRHLKECYPYHLGPEEFITSLDCFDFMDDQRIHKMIRARGIEDDVIYDGTMEKLYDYFLSESDRDLHDVLYEFVDRREFNANWYSYLGISKRDFV